MFYISCPSPRLIHFSKFPGSPYWRMELETKTWMIGTLIATRVFFLLGPVSWWSPSWTLLLIWVTQSGHWRYQKFPDLGSRLLPRFLPTLIDLLGFCQGKDSQLWPQTEMQEMKMRRSRTSFLWVYPVKHILPWAHSLQWLWHTFLLFTFYLVQICLISTELPNARFSTLTLIFWAGSFFVVKGCPVHGRMYIHGVSLLDTSSITIHFGVTTKIISRQSQTSLS